jgi:RNA polymerase sigma-70 factor (ECF subfamily)
MNVIPIDLNVYSDEEALLAGLRAGDRHACACLLKRFAPHVYAVALRMTGDPDEAEDVLQETFINACKHVQEFEGRSALGTWLHRIATNAEVSLDQPLANLEGEDIPREIADWTFYPAGHALDGETRQVIEQAIAQLPETLRTVFILREIEGLSTEETADMLGIGLSAAKVRLHRARLRLRELLTPYFALPAEEAPAP